MRFDRKSLSSDDKHFLTVPYWYLISSVQTQFKTDDGDSGTEVKKIPTKKIMSVELHFYRCAI